MNDKLNAVMNIIDRERKTVNIVGNILVPFVIGFLLQSAIPFTSWKFWAILVLVFAYRGTRGSND